MQENDSKNLVENLKTAAAKHYNRTLPKLPKNKEIQVNLKSYGIVILRVSRKKSHTIKRNKDDDIGIRDGQFRMPNSKDSNPKLSESSLHIQTE